MSRALVALLLAAALATAAALSADGFENRAVAAADLDPDTGRAENVKPPPAAGPTAERLRPGKPTANLAPRVVVPQRDRDITAAPDPTSDLEPRQLRGTGELLAAAGTSRDPVDRGGRSVQFSVEVEATTGLDPDAVVAVVEEALYDERSWARDHDLRRVAPRDAELHVVIASPDTVDTLCLRVGLRTMGWLSCWTNDTAAINVERWVDGVAHFDDLDQYRRYVVNHEVGHGLGYGHRGCPGSGRLAPLMQQQTKSLQGCVANEWQYPDR